MAKLLKPSLFKKNAFAVLGVSGIIIGGLMGGGIYLSANKSSDYIASFGYFGLDAAIGFIVALVIYAIYKVVQLIRDKKKEKPGIEMTRMRSD